MGRSFTWLSFLLIWMVWGVLSAPGASAQSAVGVTVQALRFSGEQQLLTTEERASIEAEVVGERLDFAGLQALADRVTQVLQAKGRILARAYLPPQDVTAGVLEITLVEGFVESWDFRMDDGLRVHTERLRAIASQAARPGEPLTRQGLERALMLMGDEAGVSARAALESGVHPNGTRVVVEVDEGALVTGSLSADNYGSYSTGSWQFVPSLNLNGVLGRGERFTLSTTHAQGVTLVRGGADVGLGAGGWRASGRFTSMDYTVVAGDGALAELSGESNSWNLNLTYPFIRSRSVNMRGSLGYDHRAMQDLAGGAVTRSRRVGAASASLSGDAFGAGALTTWRVGLVAGEMLLLEGISLDGSDGAYTKTTAEMSRTQPLGTRLSLVMRASGQAAGQNLDASEKFALGGPSGVRAYPSGEGSGDTGWRSSVELRYDTALGAWPGSNVQWAAFVDHGWIRLHHDPPGTIANATGSNAYHLTGAGLSATLRTARNANLQLGWAHALGENPGRTFFGTNADGTTQPSRLWVQAAFSF